MTHKLSRKIKKKLKLLIKKRTWIFVVILIFIIGIISLVFSQSKDQEDYTAFDVSRGDVVSTISSSGRIESINTRRLSFGSTGIIQEVKVKEGDIVKEGDLIAVLDTTSLQAQLMAAQGQLQTSNSSYSKVQNSLDLAIQEISKKNAELDAAVAQNLKENNEIINKNNVDRTQLTVEIGEEQLDLTEAQLKALQEEKDQALALANDNEDIQAALGSDNEDFAQEQTELTELQYDSRVTNAKNAVDLQELQNQQLNLDLNNTELSAENSNTQLDATNEKAQNAVEVTDLQYQQSLINKRYDLQSIEGQIMQAQSGINSAEHVISLSEIRAPFNSTILNIPFEQGEFYSGPGMGNTFDFVNLEEFKITIEVNELDILKIKLDQKVLIELEANPDDIYNGRVVRINPSPIVDAGGVISYEVEVSLPNNIERIYHGLSVSVDIIIEDEISVPLLPAIAVSDEDGKKYVNILNEKGDVEEREIVTGLEGDINIEVIKGLEVGDTIYY